MKTFHAWIRPLGDACRVRVDGLENGRWLLSHLIDSASVENCHPVRQEESFGFYTFLVALSPTMTPSMLGELLAAIPEVDVMCQPA